MTPCWWEQIHGYHTCVTWQQSSLNDIMAFRKNVLKFSGVSSIRKVLGIIEQKLLNVNISYKLFYAAKKGHLGFRFEKKKTLHISELKSNHLYCVCRTTPTLCFGKPCLI